MAQSDGTPVKVPALFRRIQPWDDKWLLRLNAKAKSKFTRFVEYFSFFGRLGAWILVGVFFAAVWYNPLGALYVFLNLGFGVAIIYVMKLCVNRPRPFRVTSGVLVLEGPNLSASFPSWHAYNGVAGVLALYVIYGDWMFLLIGVPFAILLGLTRPFLGVHYLTDVCAGWGLGCVGFSLSYVTAPTLLPIVDVVEKWVPWISIRGDWTPLISEWWYWAALVGGMLAFLYVSIYRRKMRKSKVVWK